MAMMQVSQGSRTKKINASGVADDLAINFGGNGATNRGRLAGFYCLWKYQERQNRKITLKGGRNLEGITLVRSFLEHSVQACSPSLIVDSDCFERMQRLVPMPVTGFR